MIPLKEIQAIKEAYQGMTDYDKEWDDKFVDDDEEEEIIKETDIGNMLVLMRALHVQNGPNEEQKLNIFKTRWPSMAK